MLSVFPSLVTAPAKFHPTTGQPAAELVLFCHLLKYQWISGFGPNPKSGQHQSNFWFKNRSNTKRWPSCGSFCPKPKHQDWDQVLNSRIKSSRLPWTNFWIVTLFAPAAQIPPHSLSQILLLGHTFAPERHIITFSISHRWLFIFLCYCSQYFFISDFMTWAHFASWGHISLTFYCAALRQL